MINKKLHEVFRQQRIKGKILDKYSLSSGNIGIIVEDEYGGRYSVEFRNNYIKPNIENLYRFVKEPFKGKGQYLDKLIEKDTYIDLTTSYSKSPLKYAYCLHSISKIPVYKRAGISKGLTYNHSHAGY